jgi:hypothetical protein
MLAVAVSLILAACSGRNVPSPTNGALQPVATIQELMQAEIDASADEIWDAVATTTTHSGEESTMPRTAEEWQAVRRNALVLIEAANLLTLEGRKLSAAPFPAEAAGALDSAEIERRIGANRIAFDQYAVQLRQTGRVILSAIDTGDPKALVAAGGALDEVCESCHMTFWYPNQVIPRFPTREDPRYTKIVINPPR